MSKRIVITVAAFAALLLQTGCAASASIVRPRLPTIVIGEAPPPAPRHEPRLPPPPPPPQRHEPRLPPPPPQPMSRHEAIALGQQWCRVNGYGCRLDEADFHRRAGIWRVEFDASRPGHNGKGKGHKKNKGRGHSKHGHEDLDIRLDIDAWSGALRDVRTRRG